MIKEKWGGGYHSVCDIISERAIGEYDWKGMYGSFKGCNMYVLAVCLLQILLFFKLHINDIDSYMHETFYSIKE